MLRFRPSWARVDLWFPEHHTVGEADGAAGTTNRGVLFAEQNAGGGSLPLGVQAELIVEHETRHEWTG